MELLEFEAEYNRPETFGTVPTKVRECISSSIASSGHRLAAATLAMISADNQGDAMAATEIFNAVRQIEPRTTAERINRLTTDAVFQCGFGELDVAPHLLHELVAEALTLTQPATRSTHIRRACFGLARYDDPEYARHLLADSLATFERLRLWTQAVVCVEDLGALAISAGRYEEAQQWIGKASEMRALGNDVFSASIEYELRVMLAFETMDCSALPQFKLPAEVSKAFLRPARSRQTHFALLGASMLVADECSSLEPILEELRVLHNRMKTRGYQDLTTAVLTRGLTRLGRDHEAAMLLAPYLRRERRERVPLPSALARIAADLGLQGDSSSGPALRSHTA
jgi:hypothetical protein